MFRVQRKEEDEPQYLKTEEYEEDERLDNEEDDNMQLDLSNDDGQGDDIVDLLEIKKP